MEMHVVVMVVCHDIAGLSLVITRKRKSFDIHVPNFDISVLCARNCLVNEAV